MIKNPKTPKTKPRKLAQATAETPKAKIGRPSDFTEETATLMCEQLALGKSLRAICESPDMPGQTTVFRWLEQNVGFREQYARARELQADTFADEIVALADKAEDANLARIQIDARKWAAAKQRPSKYSERVVNELTGKDGKPIQTQPQRVELDEKSMALVKAFLA